MVDFLLGHSKRSISVKRLAGTSLVLIALSAVLSVPFSPFASAGMGGFLEEIQKSIGLSPGLSETEIRAALREALEIGTDHAVKKVSQLNGYYGNPEIRIPLPSSVNKLKDALSAFGYGSTVDAFEKSMNRAAEKAAPKAKSLFWDALSEMRIEDARKILKGRTNEATLYFEEKTRSQLTEVFRPIIHTSMSQVGVTRQYQDISAYAQRIPFAGSLNVDLDQYVTDRALDGLFRMLAQEEQKIRQDPAARVTDLLKAVFGTNP